MLCKINFCFKYIITVLFINFIPTYHYFLSQRVGEKISYDLYNFVNRFRMIEID